MWLQEEIYRQRQKEWQVEYQKIYRAYETLEKEILDRDYEEFKAPDSDNDEMISRSEFNTYVRKYLSSFPELSENDFPRFEEFDIDGDGMISFEEWQQFLHFQKQKEAATIAMGKEKGQAGQYQELLNKLYEHSFLSDSFKNLNNKMEESERGKRITNVR